MFLFDCAVNQLKFNITVQLRDIIELLADRKHPKGE